METKNKTTARKRAAKKRAATKRIAERERWQRERIWADVVSAVSKRMTASKAIAYADEIEAAHKDRFSS